MFKKIMCLTLGMASISSYSQSETPVVAPQDSSEITNSLFDLSIEQLLGIDVVDKRFKFYGYINAYAEKTFHIPDVNASGTTTYHDAPLEWTPAKNFHLYGSGNLTDNIDVLLNIARTSDDGLELRNAWGNFKIKRNFQVRVGKIYRRFGLYNEKLDQIPTFIGIEPPELFDVDHLFLTRTTNLMVHGAFNIGSNELLYAFSTENGEGGAAKNVIPLGWDFRYKSASLILGTSGFTSSVTSERTSATVDFGKGSPRGGVLPWMQGDRFGVFGAFIEKQAGNLLIQAEYWVSPHQAQRNAEQVLTLVREGGINTNQRQRFLGAAASKVDSTLTTADVVSNVSYVSSTWYLRLGYNIDSKVGQFVPYLFLDWMSNPEVVNNKQYGGDEEAGFADKGVFFKPSLGLVYRP
ncbi:MAG TPA: hypothetical protein VL947_00405, partial [Cytophagales bacterium]|nr:hypothetical protein [Cytophagales bacterium]